VSVAVGGLDRQGCVVLAPRRAPIAALSERSSECDVERGGARRKGDRALVGLDRAAWVVLRQARRPEARPRPCVPGIQARRGEVLALGVGIPPCAERLERTAARGLELGDRRRGRRRWRARSTTTDAGGQPTRSAAAGAAGARAARARAGAGRATGATRGAPARSG